MHVYFSPGTCNSKESEMAYYLREASGSLVKRDDGWYNNGNRNGMAATVMPVYLQ